MEASQSMYSVQSCSVHSNLIVDLVGLPSNTIEDIILPFDLLTRCSGQHVQAARSATQSIQIAVDLILHSLVVAITDSMSATLH